MGKINTTNYPNRPVSSYQDDDMFILQDNGGETYTTNVGDIKTLIDNKISGKADKVSSATAGHLAGLDANGNLTDSGISVSNGTINATELVTSDGVTANDISYFNEIDLDGSSIYGVGTLNVNQVDVHDGQAVEFLTDITVNGAVADEDGNVLSNKTDKVTNATSGHLAGLDSNGNLTDSGVSPTEDVTVEGNPVTFDSPFEQDAKSVVVSVKPIQAGSGTPSPDNIRPISGIDEVEIEVHGKNYYDQSKAQLNRGVGSDGTLIVLSGDDGYASDYMKVNPLTTYKYIAIASGGAGAVGIAFYDSNENVLSWSSVNDVNANNYNITSPANAVFARCTMYIDDGHYGYFGLESIYTGLEPYVSHTTTIPLPSTLYDADVDVTEGDGTNNGGFAVFDGSEDEDWQMYGSGSASAFAMKIALPSTAKNFGTTPYINTNELQTVSVLNPWGDYDAFISQESASATNRGYIICGVKNVSTSVEAWKSFLAEHPLQVAYELATPTTISFDPADVELLEGTNVVSTNGEKVAVTYGRSLWQDIDDLKSDTEGKLDKSDVADVEGDTASRPYSVNEFMLRADGLYKVTQPIASGASITASNTTKTTIGAVLTALLNS